MTDEQLRIRAAELIGITGFQRQELIIGGKKVLGHLTGISAENGERKIVPDFPCNKIEAWKLWDVMEAQGLEPEIEKILGFYHCRCLGKDLGLADTASRAITKAFIAAMEADHEQG